jgi:Fe2+ or Zn2+ uptake regulation protein
VIVAGSSASGRTSVHPHRRQVPPFPGSQLDELITKILGASEVPLSAYTIGHMVRTHGHHGHATTIYRSLNRLVDKAIVERVESRLAYRLKTAAASVLLACSQCGATTSLRVPDNYAAITRAIIDAGFKLDKLALEAMGVCAMCNDH